MLHIILTILKIIGIVVGSLLMLILLLLAAILFTAICYRINFFYSDQNMKFDLKGRWLWGCITFKVVYTDKQVSAIVRVFGIAVFDTNKKKKESDKTKKSDSKKANKQIRTNENDKAEKKLIKEIDSTKAKEEQPKEQDLTKAKEEQPKEQGLAKVKEKKNKVADIFEKIKNKIYGIFEVIKDKINTFLDKLTTIKRKKDQILKALTSKNSKIALRKIKIHLLHLLNYLKFKKLQGEIHFGMDDPASTGKIYGYCSMLYPFYMDHITIKPDFEKKIVECDLHAKGRMRLSFFVILILKVLFDKNIKKFIQDIKIIMGG